MSSARNKPRKGTKAKLPAKKAGKISREKEKQAKMRKKEKIEKKRREKNAPDFRTTFMKSLIVKKAEIEKSLQVLLSDRKEYNGQSTAGDFIDEVDDAQREISAYSHYSLIERKTRELQKILALLARIQKEEEFGLCEECGAQIPKERLLIVPEATLCVTCQRELEKMDQRRSMASKPPANFGARKEMDWEGSDGYEEDESLMIEYHIGTLPVVDLEESGPEPPPEEKEEK